MMNYLRGQRTMNSATHSMVAFVAALQQADDEATAQGFTKGTPEWNEYFHQRWQAILSNPAPSPDAS